MQQKLTPPLCLLQNKLTEIKPLLLLLDSLLCVVFRTGINNYYIDNNNNNIIMLVHHSENDSRKHRKIKLLFLARIIFPVSVTVRYVLVVTYT